MLLIVASIAVGVVQTDDSLMPGWSPAFRVFNSVVCYTFTVEYLLRFWACGARASTQSRECGHRARWVLEPLSLLDLFTVAGFWASTMTPARGNISFASLRGLRVLRVFALFKFERYARAFRLLSGVLRAKSNELQISCFISLVLLIMCATVMYVFERGRGSHFRSIPASLLATVPAMLGGGYDGRVKIETVGGNVASMIIPFLGVSLLALPTAILGAGFVDSMQHEFGRADGPDAADECQPANDGAVYHPAHDAEAGGHADRLAGRIAELESTLRRMEAKLDAALIPGGDARAGGPIGLGD
ncbi:hypothetical protein M885DRAFT_551899 [Pelagophyceae sp. CCMP2097]|nr:hypothetical protein M885DRAFT_551899 [Pelagophyceae sp. CCMP2097]